eukprot:m.51148 g.51148  ORF g.51148 m.51148 type:complete len:313 (-) comp21403_c0_seq1:596-1534(-)
MHRVACTAARRTFTAHSLGSMAIAPQKVPSRSVSSKVTEQRLLSEQKNVTVPQMRKYFKWMNSEGYKKAKTEFSKYVSKTDVDADPAVFALMMDNSFSVDAHENLTQQMEEKWIKYNGDHIASKINLVQVLGDKEAEAIAWEQAQVLESTHRLVRLRERTDERLAQLRTRFIYTAARYGLSEECHSMFDAVQQANLARPEDYEARLWSCGSYANQLAFWQRMEEAADKNDWRPGVESYTAILWQLHLENNPEEMVKVFEHVQEMDIRPNDRMLHALQRAGQRFRQLRKASGEDRMPWETIFENASPRLRVGL